MNVLASGFELLEGPVWQPAMGVIFADAGKGGAYCIEILTRPTRWSPPGMFCSPEVLTDLEVVEAEAELRALRHHALEVIES
jgi:hypothetical protein